MFPAVLKTGRRLTSRNFSAVFSKEAGGYAVVTPKKAARLSVTRHRIKRRVFNILRTLPLPPSLIIFPKASAGGVDYEDLKAEITELLSKIR